MYSSTIPTSSSSSNSSPPTTTVFDSAYKTLQRESSSRLVLSSLQNPSSETPSSTPLDYSYIHQEVSSRLIDRLEDCKSRTFPIALDLGSPSGLLTAINKFKGLEGEGGIGGIRKLVRLKVAGDVTEEVDRIRTEGNAENVGEGTCESYTLPSPSNYTTLPLPFPSNTFDVVISSMSLHWVSDLPSMLGEVHRILKPDGAVFLAMPGGQTLPELRSSILMSSTERNGGVSVHCGPYVDVPDVGRLLQSQGFKLPTVDVDEIRVEYPNMMVLAEHLGRMGEGNASVNRWDGGGGWEKWIAAASVYQEGFGGSDGSSVEASIQVIYGIGWKEHESQQKPDKRGKERKGRIGDEVVVEVEETKNQ